jgi:thioesterase domain-containing protein
LRILYEFPTIRRLAGRIRQKQPADNGSTLMAIQPQGLKPPLFLVHGAGGGMVWGYANLARHLGAGQPVYAFQSEGLDGGEEFARVEDMAARYVADLQAFQARGPYRLGGYCFGGEVAFEMAQQLQARGESVESLILFNAMPRNSSFEQPRLNPAFIARSLVNSWQWLRYFLNWPFQAKQSFLLRKVRLARHRLGCLLGSKHAPSVSGEAGCLVDLSLYSQKRRELWDLHLRASAQYWPRPYTGNVVLFRTPIFPFFCSFDPTFGWKEFVKGILTVKVIPGAHESILDEPHVGQVAQEVAGLLDSSRDPRNRQIGHQQQTRPGLEQARRGID